MKEIKPDDYEYWGQWKQPVLSTSFWLKWNETDSFKEINIDGLKLNPILYLDGHFWISNKERQQFSELSRKIIQNKEFEKYLKFIEENYEEKFLDILNLSREDKKSYISHLFKISKDIAALWIWGYFLTEELSKIILNEGMISSEAELIEKANLVMKKTWIEKQSEDISRFAENVKSIGLSKIDISDLSNYPEFEKDVINHVNNFYWFGSHHWIGEEYDSEKCINQINDTINSSKSDSKKDIPDINDPIINLVSSGMYWRTHFAELTAKVAFKSRDLLIDIGKEVGLEYDDLVYLSCEEILDLDKNSDMDLLKINISHRKNTGYGCIVDNNIKIVTKDDLQSLLSKMLPKEDIENIKEFKGTVASKSKILQGTSKIVLSPDDFHKFNDKDILVAPETTPSYVPIMRKASAIITDIGGVTSHAAIVSRELGIPCIIGTKVATKVLKDGDLVEVDAENGIVRKVK